MASAVSSGRLSNFCFAQSIRLCQHKSLATIALASIVHGDPSSSVKPLVIAHGLFGQKQNFRMVAKAINEQIGIPVHCIDLRNHGDSPHVKGMTYSAMADDIATYIEKVKKANGVDRVHLLGHSMGGKTVMRLALTNKGRDLIDKLVVEDASPAGNKNYTPEFLNYVKILKSLDLRRSRQELLNDMKPKVPDLPLRQYFLTNLRPSREDRSAQEWKCNLDELDNYVGEILGDGLSSDKDGSYDGPVLFMRGELSDFVRDADEPLIRSLFPKVDFEKIPSARHWVHSDNPSAFVASVCRFLSK